MNTNNRVAVVIGSTRPTRICAEVADWALHAVSDASPLSYQPLDLAQLDLPFLDEPLMASLGQYQHEHTRAWSRLVDSYAGFFFVFPQYNWGYPGVLKNALDFLYAEWRDKPVSFLTYGTRGGSRAAEQFSSVLNGLHMRVLDDHIQAVITQADVDENWQLRNANATLAAYLPAMRTIDAQLTAALAAPRQTV
jgi:NAD(P)H-dependent FMN reductase